MRIIPRFRIVPRIVPSIVPRVRIPLRVGGRTRHGRHGHRAARHRLSIPLVLLTAGILVFAALLSMDRTVSAPPYPEPERGRGKKDVAPDLAQTGSITVVDGDTVKVGAVSWRLMGYDCPETYYARCASERARGDAATRRLQQLLAGAKKVDLIADRHVDRYGRQLGHLRVDDRDVGDVLIQEGMCVPYSGSTQRRDWCAN